MDRKYCPYCMTKLEEEGGRCPNCQLTDGSYKPKSFHIPPGSVLRERYLVGKVIGEGGFGITYIGCDIVLDRKVAIKEYFPRERVNRVSENSLSVDAYFGEQGRSYEKGKNKFLNEARVMARLTKEPAIVRVQDFFEDNNTAYIVMEYIEGTTLSELVTQKGGKIPPDELLPLVEPLFNALQTMHEMDFLHRDISPENIMIERGQVRLLDFGCARETFKNNETLTVFLKPGYAPIEQYQQYGQGPWTDVYALCATLYYCLTGTKPPISVNRMLDDTLAKPTKLGARLSEQQESALLAGLRVIPGRRTQSIKELHANLYGNVPVPVTGSLTVNTRIIGADGEMPDISFVISLSGKDVNPDGTYGDVTLKGGEAAVTVKGGSSIALLDIPVGTNYKVSGGDIDNYRLTNKSRAEGTVEKNASKVATFDYKSTVTPTGSLVISSKMKRRKDDDSVSATRFIVTLSGDAIDPNGTYGDVDFSGGSAEIEVSGGGSAVLSGIPAGTSYKVTGGEIDGYTASFSSTEGIVDSSSSKNVRFEYKPSNGKDPAGSESVPDKKRSPVWLPITAIAGVVIAIVLLVALAVVPKLGSNDAEPADGDANAVTKKSDSKNDNDPMLADGGYDLTEYGGLAANISFVTYTGAGNVSEDYIFVDKDSKNEYIKFEELWNCEAKSVVTQDSTDNFTQLPHMYLQAVINTATGEAPPDFGEWSTYGNGVSRFIDDGGYYLVAKFSYTNITVKAQGYDDIVLSRDSLETKLSSCTDIGNDFWYVSANGGVKYEANIDLTDKLARKLNTNKISTQEFVESYFPAVYEIVVRDLTLDSLVAYPKEDGYEPELTASPYIDLTEAAWFGASLSCDWASLGASENFNGVFEVGDNTAGVPKNDEWRAMFTKESTNDYTTFKSIWMSPAVALDPDAIADDENYRLYAVYSYNSIIFRAEGYDDIVLSGKTATAWFDYTAQDTWSASSSDFNYLTAELKDALAEKGINIEGFVEDYFPAVYEVGIYGLKLDNLTASHK